MEFTHRWQTSALAAALSLALVGCGSSDSDDTAPVVVNVAPVISSAANTAATEDIEYSYQVSVTDPDDSNNGTDLNFSLENAPEGMNISSTGLITWTPLEGVLTSNTVTLVVADGGEDDAGAATQEFEVTVTPVNDAPTVVAVPAQNVESGQSFTYQLVVNDIDDSNIETDINFELITGPDSLSISPAGLVSYQSAAAATVFTDIAIKVSDGGEDGVEPVIVDFVLEEQFFVPVNGTTLNYFNGEVITDSQISISNGTNIIDHAVSDADGLFSFKLQDTSLSQRLTLSADASHYAEAALSVSLSEVTQEHQLLLQPVHALVSFDATQEAELSVEGNVLVSLPANSLVDTAGNLVTDAVAAELTIINPAIDIEMMPGDMTTLNESGDVVPIESFGAITVTFEDTAGNPLQLAQGQSADIFIPAAGETRPMSVPLYYFDEVTGLWVEEGEAVLTTSASGEQFYEGSVSHFTTWNADRIYDTVFVNGCVEDSNGNLLADARIISDGRDYLGRSTTYSLDDGTFSLPVKMDSTVLIAATLGFQSRTSIVNVGSSDFDLGSCLVLSEALTKITLNWGEQPTDLDSHLFITDVNGSTEHVYFANGSVELDGSLIYLDVDDITSYGPEVISIPDFPVEGVYDYYVHNFSRTPAIAPETTRVEVIFNNQQYLFSPPTEDITLWWHVAKIEKMADGELVFTPYNEWVAAPTTGSQPQSSGPSIQAIIAPKAIESVVKGLIETKYYSH